MKALASALALCALTACAHGPSPAERRQAYFTCSGITVDAAAANLEAAGLAVEPREAGAPAKTGWIEATVSQDGVNQELSLYVKVAPRGAGVGFDVVQAGPEGDIAWDEVTEAQVRSDPYRTLLNKLRRDVCGTPDQYFTKP